MPKKKRQNLEEQVKELANIIDSLEDQKLEITNQLKRALADYQNLEKDVDKLMRLRFLQTKKDFITELIPIVDSLTIALNKKEELNLDEKANAWVEGLVATIEKFEKTFSDIGLSKFVPLKGDQFNADKHEAVATVEDGDKGKIYETLQPGYLLDDILIRPARVVVSK